MGFTPDSSTLIEIDSSRGLDGSTALTQIPDGFCEEMENADISSKGVIRCRKGFKPIGGQTYCGYGSGEVAVENTSNRIEKSKGYTFTKFDYIPPDSVAQYVALKITRDIPFDSPMSKVYSKDNTGSTVGFIPWMVDPYSTMTETECTVITLRNQPLFTPDFVVTDALYLLTHPLPKNIDGEFPITGIKGFTSLVDGERLAYTKAGMLFTTSLGNTTAVQILKHQFFNPYITNITKTGAYHYLELSPAYGKYYSVGDTVFVTAADNTVYEFTVTDAPIVTILGTKVYQFKLTPAQDAYPLTITPKNTSYMEFRRTGGVKLLTNITDEYRQTLIADSTDIMAPTTRTWRLLGSRMCSDAEGIDSSKTYYTLTSSSVTSEMTYPELAGDPVGQNYADLTKPIPMAALNSSVYCATCEAGVITSSAKYTHTNLSRFTAPRIQAWRSIPNSTSTFPADIGSDGGLGDTRVELIFTFRVPDGAGRYVESGPSNKLDGVMYAKPSQDGSPYSENLEIKIRPPEFDILTTYQICTYIRVLQTSQGEAKDLGYVQYATKTVNKNIDGDRVVVVGTTSTSSILSNPSLPSEFSDYSVSAPRPSVLVEHNGRLVAGNVVTPAHAKVTPVGFLPDGSFMHLSARGSDAYLPTIITVPFGLGTYSGATRPPANWTDYGTGVRDMTTAVEFTTSPIMWWDDATSMDGFTVSYTDNSNRLKVAIGTGFTNFSPTTTKFLFRTASQTDLRTATCLNLAGDPLAFSSVVSAGASYYLSSATKWTDYLTSAGTSPTLDATTLIPFVNTPTDSAATVNTTTIKSGNAELRLRGTTLKYLVIGTGTQPDVSTSIYILYGLGEKGSLSYVGSTSVLNFNSDLTFRVAAAAPATETIAGNSYNVYDLIPVTLVKKVISGTTYTTVQDITGGFNGVASEFNNDATSSYEVTWFRCTTGTQGSDKIVPTARTVTAVTELTNPPVGFTVSKTGLGARVVVGDYVSLEFSDAEYTKIQARLPIAQSGSYKVLTNLNDVITLESKTSELSQLKLVSFSATTAADAGGAQPENRTRIVFLKTLFPTVSFGGLDFTSARIVDYSYTAIDWAFMVVRGITPESTNLSASGYFKVQRVQTASNPAVYSFIFTNGFPSNWAATSSGVRYSYLITASVGFVPVPVPLIKSSSELQDLANPVFGNSYVNGSVYHSFSRRAAALPGISSEGIAELSLTTENGQVLLLGKSDSSYFFVNTTDAIVYGAADYGAVAEVTPRISHRSRLQWTNLIAATQQNSNQIPMFRYKNISDIISGDDTEITGMTSVQNALIVMKGNSAFRCTFNEDNTLTTQRIQSPVGAFGIYNLPTTLSYGYMLHDTGVYFTDGNTVENLFKLSKRFDVNGIKNTSTFALAAGYTDHVNKTMQIGMPYISRYHTTYWPVDAQFVYTYNDGVLGWSVNTGIPATCWTRYKNTDVFGSFDGRIYAMNTRVTEPWAYSDAGVAIDFAIRTRFSDGGDRVRFKFYRNAIFQFGTEGDVTTRVYYTSNFSNVENPLQLYKISGSTTTDGKISWRNDKFLKTLRDTMAMRVAQISFTLISAVRRSSAPLYGVFLEGFRTNSRLINQKETPGNTRT